MKSRAIFFILLQIFIVDAITWNEEDDNEQQEDELVFVQAVWRHGDRTPELLIKTDPDNREETWPSGLGQLTPIGMEQHYWLGQRLRRRYIEDLGLISKIYKGSEIYIRSSDSDRTLMSAASNMVGFYSNEAEQYVHILDLKSSPSVKNDSRGGVKTDNVTENYYPLVKGWPNQYVPVPIHTVPHEADQIPNTEAPCERRDKIDQLLQKTAEYANLFNKTKPFLNELSRLCEEEVNLENVWRFWDVLIIEQIHNRTHPKWLTEEVRKKLSEVDQLANSLFYGIGVKALDGIDFAVEIPKIRGGPLLWSLIDNMRQKADCLDQKNTVRGRLWLGKCKRINRLKYYAFSMHDVTLRALTLTLGLRNVTQLSVNVNAPYATTVTMELWQKRRNSERNTYFVKLLLWPANRTVNDETAFEDITDKISGCDEMNGEGCSLKLFEERSRIFRPEPSIEKLCENGELATDMPNSCGRHLRGFYIFILAYFTIIINAWRI